MSYWIGSLLTGAGACALLGLINLTIAYRWRDGKRFLLLGVLGVLAAVSVSFEVVMYTAETVEVYGRAEQWQIGTRILWVAILVLFVAEYVNGLRRVARVVSVPLLISTVANAFSTHGLDFDEVTGLRAAVLPWGERVTLGLGEPDPFRVLLVDSPGWLAAAFCALACVRAVAHRTRSEAALLTLCMVSFFGAALVHSRLVNMGFVDLPYLGSPAILLAVLLLSAKLGLQVANGFRLNQEVVAGQRRWRSLLDSTELLIAGVDPSGRIMFANRQLSLASGRSENDLEGMAFGKLVREQDPSRAGSAAENEADPVETRLATNRDENLFVRWRRVRMEDDRGRDAGFIGVGVDVTNQRRVEADRDLALEELQELRRQLEEENLYLREELESEHDYEEIVGISDQLGYVLHRVSEVASLDTTVLIQGETGVGKELVARAIHDRSTRSKRPFVRVNCAALAINLAESEFFGHQRGAFTGAHSDRPGRFELADGGTIFLDEIGELPMELQPKLLRVLQSGEFERVGSSATQTVDVRVIAATNRNLEAEVKNGEFRADLFYRLSVYPLTVPPLRERREDIGALVRHFVPRLAGRLGKTIEEVPAAVLRKLEAYDWPGNVRELLNVLERAVITSPGPLLRLPDGLSLEAAAATSYSEEPLLLADVERRHIQSVLESTDWQVSGPAGAAKLLGLHPSTLRGRMRKLAIARPEGNGSTVSGAIGRAAARPPGQSP